jgi:hypothetical protein
MLGAVPSSTLDIVFLMAPVAVFMILAMFGLDERLASDHTRNVRRRRFCELSPDGRGLLTDPDGRLPQTGRFPRPRAGLGRKPVRNGARASRRSPAAHDAERLILFR